MRTPVVLLNDPEIIKRIAVKEFNHFVDHVTFVDETMDVLFGNSLFSMRGTKWRDMRATLSPAFTGSKMRNMFPMIDIVAHQMIDQLKKDIEQNQGIVEVEMKDVSSRFTTDVIAITAFGIEVDSFKDPKNEFFTEGQRLNAFSTLKGMLKYFGFRLVPWLMRLLKIQFFDDLTTKFFRDIVLGSMDYRWKNKITRPDMINLLMEVRHGNGIISDDHGDKDNIGFATVQESAASGKESHKREWLDNELVAQCFLFFLGGFDTSATLMSFAAYELATNPEIQERLLEEIKEHHDFLGGKSPSYESIQKLLYLDMVVSETLRKWPPIGMSDRTCTKTLEFDDNQGLKYTFEKDTHVWINISGIHNNPKYFPNPEQFDPERFNEENRRTINPDAYFPFGVGPRNCIGSRFALMAAKVMLYELVLNFELTTIQKTQVPIKIKKTLGNLATEDGIWIGLKMRNNSN